MNKVLSVLFLVMFNYCQSFWASAAVEEEKQPLTMFRSGEVYVVGTCHVLDLRDQATALRATLDALSKSNPYVVTEKGGHEVDTAALRYGSENLSLEQFARQLNTNSPVRTKKWSEIWPTVPRNLPPEIRARLTELERDAQLPMCSRLHPLALTKILDMMVSVSLPSMDSQIAASLSASTPQGLETASDILETFRETNHDALSNERLYWQELEFFRNMDFSQGMQNDESLPKEEQAQHQCFFNFGARYPWLEIPHAESESEASRNTKWRSLLDPLLASARRENRPLVVVVGAGHLPGQTGMLRWLESLDQNAEPSQSVMQLWTDGQWRRLETHHDTSKLPDTASDQDKQYLADLIRGLETVEFDEDPEDKVRF